MTARSADSVRVGTIWRGISGSLLMVTQVEGDRACVAYVDDPTDASWEPRSEIAEYLRLAESAPGAVLNPEAIGNPDATPVVCLSPEMIAAMGGCICGGLNGFHADECAGFVPWRPSST